VAVTIASLLLPVLLAACAGDDGDGGTSADAAALLKGQPLVLVSGIDLPQDAAVARPSATFENETVAGSTGCNRYTAGFTIDGDSLGIGEIATTRMACAPPADAIERAYLAALAQVAGWRTADDELVLIGEDEAELLRYERATPVGSWQVTGLLSGDAFTSPLGGTELTATFGDDGRLGGSSGCNTYTAEFTTAKGAIEIASVAGTKKACAEPAGVMEQETTYLALLPTAAAFRLDGRALELLDVDDKRLVSFTRAAQP
jgi:heat shock protein HslJ